LIPIVGLDKAEVLAALYNYAQPQGLGFIHFNPTPMTREEAKEIIDNFTDDGHTPYFDYLRGRVMKVELSGDELDEYLYDRSNGKGAMEKVITALREGRETPILERERLEAKLTELVFTSV
jgi:hypothetical protein